MKAERLEAALVSAIGPDARVEERGRVAILQSAIVPLDAASRRRIVALAREHGFANVALELAPDANLSGD